jgi:hypothetical protein
VKFNVVKASGHGLGFLHSPGKKPNRSSEVPLWILQAWAWILQKALGLQCETPPWFDLPAMMRFTITTPEVLKILQARQREIAYRDRTKPFSFILSPILDELTGHPIGTDPDKLLLISPYSTQPQQWYDLLYLNVYDGKEYKLGQPGKRLSYEAEPKTYGDVVRQYPRHAEAKSLAPGGGDCSPETVGLLLRTPVVAVVFRHIGKENDRRWEKGEDLSMLAPHLTEYHPNETARLTTDPVLQLKAKQVSIRILAKEAGVSEKTVKAVRKGQRVRRSTSEKLRNALLHM